jgi:hypothetical protein
MVSSPLWAAEAQLYLQKLLGGNRCHWGANAMLQRQRLPGARWLSRRRELEVLASLYDFPICL